MAFCGFMEILALEARSGCSLAKGSLGGFLELHEALDLLFGAPWSSRLMDPGPGATWPRFAELAFLRFVELQAVGAMSRCYLAKGGRTGVLGFVNF